MLTSMGFLDVFTRKRDAAPTPVRVIGMPSDGGLVYGVTGTTALGLSAVWRSLDILSNGVSQLPWVEKRGNLELPSSRLILRPQSTRTRREWTSLVISTLALYDYCVLLKVGGPDSENVPMGLWPVAPQLVTPQYTDVYAFEPPEYWNIGYQTFHRDELVILHRSPQPGITEAASGVLSLARATFASAISAENYASRYWQSGGSVQNVLETDANVPDQVAKQIQERWNERRALGPDHTPVLTNGLRVRSLGVDPLTEAATEARKEIVSDIGRFFGIPTALLNSPASDSETYSSTEAQGINLVNYTLRNYISALEDAITDLLPGGRRLFIDPSQLTKGTFVSRAQAYQLATGGKAWMTPSDVREAEGLPPLENPSELNPAPVSVPVSQKVGVPA